MVGQLKQKLTHYFKVLVFKETAVPGRRESETRNLNAIVKMTFRVLAVRFRFDEG